MNQFPKFHSVTFFFRNNDSFWKENLNWFELTMIQLSWRLFHSWMDLHWSGFKRFRNLIGTNLDQPSKRFLVTSAACFFPWCSLIQFFGPLSQFTVSLSHCRLAICLGEVEVIRSEPSDVFWHNLQTTRAEVRINEWTACPRIREWMDIAWFWDWWDLKKHWRMVWSWFLLHFDIRYQNSERMCSATKLLQVLTVQWWSARPSPRHSSDMTTFSVTRKSLGEVGVSSEYLRDCVWTVDPGSSEILKSGNFVEFQRFTSWIVGLFSKSYDEASDALATLAILSGLFNSTWNCCSHFFKPHV